MRAMFQVFIAHASSDKVRFVRRLCRDLRKRGVTVWIDEDAIRVGDSLFESIQRGLEVSQHVVVVLSRASVRRSWFRSELAAAFNLERDRRGTRILPVLIENCSIPTFLKDKRFADFRSSYVDGLGSVLTALGIAGRNDSWQNFYALSSTVLLDVHQRDGRAVSYEKRLSLVCTRDAVADTVESFTADGTMSAFSTAPGTIAGTWTESGRQYIRIVYRSPLRLEQRLQYVFRMQMQDAFTRECEYWEGIQHGPADHYRLSVRFPRQRPPTRWATEERVANKVTASRWTARRYVRAERTTLRLDVKDPEMFRSYILRWCW